METNQYEQIKKAARKSKIQLSGNILFNVLFIIVVGIMLSYITPQLYYKYLDSDRIKIDESKPYDWSIENAVADSKRERYKNNWFYLTQNNRRYDPLNFDVERIPFGKIKTYGVTKNVGNRTELVATIREKFIFGHSHSIEFDTSEQEQNFYSQTLLEQTSVSPKELIEMLKAQGQYKVANIQIQFNYPLSRTKLPETKEVNLLRYTVDYPNGDMMSPFGYPAYTIANGQEREFEEKTFVKILKQTAKDFDTYGIIGLDRDFPKYSQVQDGPQKRTIFPKNIRSPFSTFLHQSLTPLKDAVDYIDHNGVKYSGVVLTGSCDQLAQWLEKYDKEINAVEIQELDDWDYRRIGVKDYE